MRTRILDRELYTAILLITLLSLPLGAEASSAMMPTPEFEPVFHPEMTIRQTTGRIEIDGNLDESAWKCATRSDRFVERTPGDLTQPEVPTEVLVTYDADNLYVAFICHDDPNDLRATMCRRDEFSGDDCAIVLIDTYGSASLAYEFFVNPHGVQRDQLWTPTRGEDLSYDMIWDAAAKITPDGYQVEMAIPFAGMRFPDRDLQSWRMDFLRNRPRGTTYQYGWSAYHRGEQCWPCQWGTVHGIDNVTPGKGVELLSSLVANQSGRGAKTPAGYTFTNDDIDGEMSLAGKYAFSSAITMEGTWNPDYSQIESDAAQIDINSPVALLYPEHRPFFQEGADIFQTLFNSFASRYIRDPQYAAKATGRTGRTSIGFLTARDEISPYTIPLEEMGYVLNAGNSVVNILRGSLSFGRNSRTGFMLTDRRYDYGGYGTVLSFDADIRLSRHYSWVGQFISSFTGEPDRPELFDNPDRFEGFTFDNGKHTILTDGESYSGTAMITQLRRRGRHLNGHISYDQVSPSYRTQTGYDPWNNYRTASAHAQYTFYPQHGLLERLTPSIGVDRRWNYDGDIKWSHFNSSLNYNFRFAQSYATVSYSAGSENWAGRQYDGLYSVGLRGGGRISNAVGFNAGYTRGRGVALRQKAIGNEEQASFGLTLKPLDRLLIEPSCSYARSRDLNADTKLYEQLITRTRIQFQANRELSLRLVVQYNDAYETWALDPLLTYQLSPFSVFYIGTTYDYGNFSGGAGEPDDWRLTSRRIFMKLQYLFQT